jgi:hypothetical protein
MRFLSLCTSAHAEVIALAVRLGARRRSSDQNRCSERPTRGHPARLGSRNPTFWSKPVRLGLLLIGSGSPGPIAFLLRSAVPRAGRHPAVPSACSVMHGPCSLTHSRRVSASNRGRAPCRVPMHSFRATTSLLYFNRRPRERLAKRLQVHCACPKVPVSWSCTASIALARSRS